MQCVLQCVLQNVLQCDWHCVLHCVLLCVLQGCGKVRCNWCSSVRCKVWYGAVTCVLQGLCVEKCVVRCGEMCVAGFM